MTLEFEGIFLVSWIFRIVILSYVTNQKINLYYLLLPFIFLGIYIINYDIVFWGEIFLLPLSLIIVKNKYNWNWSQYIFYSFFHLSFLKFFQILLTYTIVFYLDYLQLNGIIFFGLLGLTIVLDFYFALDSLSYYR